ncbi:hypothetical protein C8C83_3513 [Flavobacterium sp. 90]|uniref:DUF1254 domain-containing protein n=1 Tax=unclassified Flavobacterium TaxID=196869 RepID=UPI000EB3CDEF|nr:MULTISPECIES: DUF1254 domain-containing protein [unclassified Flavobacterium]RKR11764.1 hypothetical protein C8C82_3831 [Flavobacterium sp. 81]TCK55539.1 hypothetical protein C8C83_3513 [Flavobacterium sp. 90]
MKKVLISLLFALLLTACNKSTTKNTETTNDADTVTTAFKPANIKEQILYQRGVEAAIWGMPAVNFQLMYDGFTKINGNYNQVVIWPKLLDWKNQTLTPNPDVIYLMPFFNTEKVGPVVLEIPPADNGVFNGSVMTYWQNSLDDVGPGGVDKGKGGKYLFLPPGYDKNKIPSGYIPLQSDTYRGYALLRSVLKSGSDDDVAAAVAYSKRIKVYPLSEASKNPVTTFIDASDKVYESNIPYDFSFYESLNKIIQEEPWLERDRAMIDPLKTLGIERGKTFSPDARTKEILAASAKTAKKWLDFNYESINPFFKGTHWIFPATEDFAANVRNMYHVSDSYPTDNRGMIYMIAFFSAKHLGESQFYLMQIVDKDGNALDGSSTYKVNVPANAPVKQYWSMTVYNRDTHTFIRNVKWAGRSSQTPGLKRNSDGSVDLYFGPTPPESGESNWVPTDPKGKFEILARFYGPTPNLYDQSWKLNDLEKVK